jgi:hypothetical protein
MLVTALRAGYGRVFGLQITNTLAAIPALVFSLFVVSCRHIAPIARLVLRRLSSRALI